MQAHLPGNMSEDAVAIRQRNPEHRVRQYFHYRTFDLDGVFARHVKISGSDSVIRTVCSK